MIKECYTCRLPKTANRTKDSEFSWRKDRQAYYSNCKECKNGKARERRNADKLTITGTQRIKITGGISGTEACDRCPLGVRLMCTDRVLADRAVLCEVMTEEEREFEYENNS